MKAAIYTLGCKVNQYESQALAELLAQNGYTIVDPRSDADVFIVNSCTVTAEADRKTRQHVRKFKREHPEAIVVLTGCLPQAFPADAAALTEADIVIGNKNTGRLLELLDTYQKTGSRAVQVQQHEMGDVFAPAVISAFEERTRAFVKIQDGCNRFCSYCIIPYARGRVRSKPLDAIRAELETLAANGYKEVVLVGINLSSYGQDSGSGFAEAVELACSVPRIKRVRLGSLEPDHLMPEVLDRLAKCEKLCPQFHLSLQSGCDRTLKAMNRHYNTKEFRALCENLRARFADCTLSTDVMVGFCGESEEDFEESLAFVRAIGFEKLHVFPYSVRTGTRAAAMDGHLPKAVKEARAARMLALGKELRTAFFARQIGKQTSVLFESTLKDGCSTGCTANYTPVLVRCGRAPVGEILPVTITGAVEDEYCVGTLSDHQNTLSS